MISNLGDVSLVTSAIMGEARKGLIPSSGVPGSVASLARFLGYRKVLERRFEQRARDTVLCTEFLQGAVDPAEFILRVSGSDDPAYLDELQARWLEVFFVGAQEQMMQALAGSGQSGIDKLIYQDIGIFLNHCRATGAPPAVIAYLPVTNIYSLIEEKFTGVQRTGGRSLLGISKDESDFVSSLLVNPLEESSWGLDKSKRKVRS